MPLRSRPKGTSLQLIEGGRGKPQRPAMVELTVRVPLVYRLALRRWAFEENVTMSELVQRELRPPSRSKD
jgi:hypothetical protein